MTSSSRKPELARAAPRACATRTGPDHSLMLARQSPPQRGCYAFDPTRAAGDPVPIARVSVTFVPTVTCRKRGRNTEPGPDCVRRRTAPRRPAAAARPAAGRRSRRRRRRAPGGASWPGRCSPGAIRRAVTRKPVWPIILWPGRIARPSTCQSRTSVSQGCGSVNPPCARSVSTVRPSWVVVATYAQTMPPGRAPRRPRRRTPTGRACRGSPGRRRSSSRRLDEVADGELPGRVRGRRRTGRRSARATSANSWRRSYDETRPCGPTARSSEQVSAPEPTPASTTGRPGRCRPSPRSGRRPWGRPPPPARHRDHELVEQRPEHEVLPARGRGDLKPSARPIRSSWSMRAAVGEELLARARGRCCAGGPWCR